MTLISSERVYSGKLLNIDYERVLNPNKQELDLEIVRHPGASAVVPVLSPLNSNDPTLLLLRQFRHAADGEIWEIPAGVLEPEEAPLDCAHRELKEETGATAGQMTPLTTILTTPGFTDERIHLFLASDISVGEARLEPDEYIQTSTRPLSKVLEMIRDGEITDAKSVIGILFFAGFTLNS